MAKNILVSGAGGQLGQVVVREFGNAGYHVIGTVRQIPVVAAIDNISVEYSAIDLTQEETVATFIQQLIVKKERIHAAALVAGGFSMNNFADTSYTDIEKMLTLNFKTAYTLVRPLFEHMMHEGGGTIILVASKQAIDPAQGKGAIAYTLSKSLLLTLAQLLNEQGEGKVVIHIIAPGTIDTSENREAMPKADRSTWVSATTLTEKMLELCETPFVKGNTAVHKFY